MEIRREEILEPERVIPEKIIPEKVTTTEVYVAKDGTIFDKKHHCQHYECECDFNNLPRMFPIPLNVQLISLDKEFFADIIYIENEKDIEIISKAILIYDYCQTFNFKLDKSFIAGYYVLIYKTTYDDDRDEVSNFNLIPIKEYLERLNGVANWYNEKFK